MYAGSGSLVTVDSATATAAPADHAGRTVLLDRAAGIAVTLPAAAGTGHTYKFIVLTTITSNSTTIKVASASDTMTGVAIVANDTDNSASIFEAGATADTITFNGSTTMGIKGDIVELQDIASGLWSVKVTGSATGTEATPFSATVS
jgi:hypothetical protein